MQSVVGALEGAASTSYGGPGYVIGHRSRTVVVETWVVRTLVSAWCPVCVMVVVHKCIGEREERREGEMCVWDVVGTCIRELHCANTTHDGCNDMVCCNAYVLELVPVVSYSFRCIFTHSLQRFILAFTDNE